MFTGIVQALGTLTAVEQNEKGSVLSIHTPADFLNEVKVGDSICVQGVCLTATSITKDEFNADVSYETLQCTTLSEISIQQKLNLELALTLSTRLGGHLVTGHVDGVGQLLELEKQGGATNFTFKAPSEIAKYIARKGSVCIDGISLTVNDVNEDEFKVTIIPHTLENTTISNYEKNSKVNLEVDLVARYVERLRQYNN